MSDTWTERLSEYVDGTLPDGERTALEAHLDGCAACATTLAELRHVVTRAHALDDRPPARDLWPGIAERIGSKERGAIPADATEQIARLEPRRARRRLSFTVPQLAAAGLALAVLSGGGAWMLVRQRAVVPAGTPEPTPVLVTVSASEPRYAAAVVDLERALQRSRSRLDTATVRVIERNLAIIDRAIRDAQSALAGDPGNAYLNLHLADQMRRKLELLRRASVLASAQS